MSTNSSLDCDRPGGRSRTVEDYPNNLDHSRSSRPCVCRFGMYSVSIAVSSVSYPAQPARKMESRPEEISPDNPSMIYVDLLAPNGAQIY